MKKCICFCIGIIGSLIYAQDGAPDLTFGSNGVVVYNYGETVPEVQAVDESENGRILAVVQMTGELEIDIEIIAFNEDGTFDTTFGNDGVLELAYIEDSYFDLQILNDGSFYLMTKPFSNQITISKFLENGDPDMSFGTNGNLEPMGNGEFGNFMLVNDDNSFFVQGNKTISGVPQLLFYKFLENGEPDNSFGNNGMILHSLDNFSSVIHRNFIHHDEYLYLGVNSNDINNPLRYIYRFLTNGSLDTTFGINGRIEVPMEEEYGVNFSVFQEGDFLISGGYWDMVTESYLRKTIKINAQGELIQNFGNIGAINGRAAVYIQANQRFIADGSMHNWEGGVTLNYSRFYSNGSLDGSFNFSTNYGEVGGYIMKQLHSGKILIIGNDIWYNGPDLNLVLQRFNNDPLNVPDYEKNNVAVYPNPSKRVFHIHSEIPFNNTSFEIFDSLGKKVFSGHFNQNLSSFDLSRVDSGVYFLKIADSSQTFKLLKR